MKVLSVATAVILAYSVTTIYAACGVNCKKACCASKAQVTQMKKACDSNCAKPRCASKDQQSAVKAQTACPIMGGKINKDIYADHEGQRVYFCCAGCVSTFNADPEKYLEKMKAEGITPDVTPEN